MLSKNITKHLHDILERILHYNYLRSNHLLGAERLKKNLYVFLIFKLSEVRLWRKWTLLIYVYIKIVSFVLIIKPWFTYAKYYRRTFKQLKAIDKANQSLLAGDEVFHISVCSKSWRCDLTLLQHFPRVIKLR